MCATVATFPQDNGYKLTERRNILYALCSVVVYCTSCGTATSTVVRFPFKLRINLDTFFAVFDICDFYPLLSE